VIDAVRAGFARGAKKLGESVVAEAVTGYIGNLAALPPAQAALIHGGTALGGGLVFLAGTQAVRGILWVYDSAVNGRRW
jgi:hypothetical protein